MIRALFKLIVILSFFGCLHFPYSDAFALMGETQTRDIDVRSFEQAKIEDLRNDKDFNYETRAVGRIGLWEKIQMTISQFLGWLFNNITLPGGSVPVKLIFYSILGLIMVYTILKLLGVDMRGIFLSSDSGNLNFEVEEENIHEMDFNSLIEEAVSRKEYRKAIRYIYLYALKKLSDKQMINWLPGKTNDEYIYEIQNTEVKDPFDRLSYFYEYAWYGDFEIRDDHFQKVSDLFARFKERV